MDRRSLLFAVLVLGTGQLSASCASAGSGSPNGGIKALVVGNSYDNAESDEDVLLHAELDAADFAAGLTSLGHKVSLSTGVDGPSFLRALETFEAELHPTADDAVFFFAGHGVQVDGRNFLVMNDLNSLIAVADILNGLRSKAASVTLILDACRNNPFANQNTQENVRSLKIFGASELISSAGLRSQTKGLAEISLRGRGVKVVFSTDPGNVAFDGENGQRNSPFMTAMLKHMPDNTSFDEVLANVTRDVSDTTNREQTPWQQGSTDKLLYLSKRPLSFNSGTNRMPIP